MASLSTTPPKVASENQPIELKPIPSSEMKIVTPSLSSLIEATEQQAPLVLTEQKQ